MNGKRIVWIMGALLVLVALVLTACGGGGNGGASGGETTTGGEATTETGETGETTAPEPEATPEPQDLFPDVLVIHPDAFDFEADTATNTYIYQVPVMVAEISSYLETELKAKGWEPLGAPVLMGHLATVNMQSADYNLNISMQDNERSMTTRVQMILHKK